MPAEAIQQLEFSVSTRLALRCRQQEVPECQPEYVVQRSISRLRRHATFQTKRLLESEYPLRKDSLRHRLTQKLPSLLHLPSGRGTTPRRRRVPPRVWATRFWRAKHLSSRKGSRPEVIRLSPCWHAVCSLQAANRHSFIEEELQSPCGVPTPLGAQSVAD